MTTTPPGTTTPELSPSTIRSAIADVRWAEVDRVVSRRIDRRGGDFNPAQIEQWTQAAVEQWNAEHPELIALWLAIDEGCATITVEPAAQSGR